MDIILACPAAWFYMLDRIAADDVQRIYVLVFAAPEAGAVYTRASRETVPFLNKVE